MKLISCVRGAVLALGLAAAALPAVAQEVIAATPEDFVIIMEEMGYETSINHDDGDGPIIVTRSGALDVNFEIAFESCDEDGWDCEVVSYKAGFNFAEGEGDLSETMANNWNATYWGKALFQEDGKTIWLMLETNVTGGVTKENVTDTLNWWEVLMADFVVFIGWSSE